MEYFPAVLQGILWTDPEIQSCFCSVSLRIQNQWRELNPSLRQQRVQTTKNRGTGSLGTGMRVPERRKVIGHCLKIEKKNKCFIQYRSFQSSLQWIIMINDVNSRASTICCLITHLFWPNEEYLLNIKKERHRNYFKPFEDERPAEVVLLWAFGFPALSVQPHCCMTGWAADRIWGHPIHLSSGWDRKLQSSSYPTSPSLRNTR